MSIILKVVLLLVDTCTLDNKIVNEQEKKGFKKDLFNQKNPIIDFGDAKMNTQKLSRKVAVPDLASIS